MNPIPESKLVFCKLNFVHICHYSYLNLPYYGKNPFSGSFIVAKNIIYKHFAKNLKYSRKTTVIRTKSKRIIPVWQRNSNVIGIDKKHSLWQQQGFLLRVFKYLVRMSNETGIGSTTNRWSGNELSAPLGRNKTNVRERRKSSLMLKCIAITFA